MACSGRSSATRGLARVSAADGSEEPVGHRWADRPVIHIPLLDADLLAAQFDRPRLLLLDHAPLDADLADQAGALLNVQLLLDHRHTSRALHRLGAYGARCPADA